MISDEYYMNSKLMIEPEFDSRYKDVKVNNVICGGHPIHMHNCIEIVYVFEGELECKVSFEKYIIKKGEFAVFNAFEIHQLSAVIPGTKISYIYISQDLFSYSEGFIIWWADILKQDKEVFLKQADNIKLLIKQYEQFESEDVIYGSIDRIIQLFKASFKVENFKITDEHNAINNSIVDMKRISDIYIYMYRNCDERLSLEKMAAEFAMSKYYLSHYIKKITGVSLQKMINVIRCDRAEVALLDSTKTVEAICTEFSFSSNQYFNTIFKSLYGITPGAYRKKFIRDTIAYRAFDERPIDLGGIWLEPAGNENSDNKIIEIKLKDNADRIVVIESSEKGENLKTYSVRGKNKMCISVGSSNAVIFIKKQ